MDLELHNETSNMNKTIAQRLTAATVAGVEHLEPIPKKMSNVINTTDVCHDYTIQPDFGTYLAALQSYAWALWSVELLILLVTYILYIITLRSALRHWRQCKVNVGVVLAVYPLVSTAAFLAVVLPRARLLAEAIAQEAVMLAFYHLYSMVVAECGGADQFVRSSSGARLETRVVPCCCWPCCAIPRPVLHKRHLSWLRYLVLQMPVIQGILYTLILVLSTEDMSLYMSCFAYIQPFIAASILSGVWGVVMSVKAAATAGHNIRPRFFAVQLCLLIVKLQCGFAKVLPELAHLPCILPLNPSVFTNMIQNSVMMLEMLCLSIWALYLYRTPPGKDLDKARNVSIAVMEENCPRTIEIKTAKEGVENKSYMISRLDI